MGVDVDVAGDVGRLMVVPGGNNSGESRGSKGQFDEGGQ